jgi:hypothetical protein
MAHSAASKALLALVQAEDDRILTADSGARTVVAYGFRSSEIRYNVRLCFGPLPPSSFSP